ncbi:rCG21339 [Rattus norvegicus]|uniref:RCG21339 n=1 Tax=Rattus norvegicus TaxID=10116 RepID=A6J299_RAT|nr:rCG21339 [Rattus norvegicus]
MLAQFAEMHVSAVQYWSPRGFKSCCSSGYVGIRKRWVLMSVKEYLSNNDRYSCQRMKATRQ